MPQVLQRICSISPTLLKKSLKSLVNISNRYVKNEVRFYSSKNLSVMKVTVCGAAGNVGQPLCLMLKQCPLIDELTLYDITGTCGFGMELGHVDTKCKVSAFTGCEHIKEAFSGSKVVVFVAAAPKTNYLSYSAMFEPNALIVSELTEAFSQFCPKALLAIATNPVNSIVPLISEILKRNSTYDPLAVFGITSLNVVRTNTFVATVQGLEPECVVVPVIGGNADKSIVPVLSHSRPCSDFTNEELEKITHSVQMAHHDIIKAKTNLSATLSPAFAIARFVISLVKGLRGQTDIVECAFVRSSCHPHAKYLATPLQFGPGGIQRNLGIPKLSEYESCLLENAVTVIMQDVKRGEMFVGVEDPPPCDPCNPDPKAPPCPIDYCKKEASERLCR